MCDDGYLLMGYEIYGWKWDEKWIKNGVEALLRRSRKANRKQADIALKIPSQKKN